MNDDTVKITTPLEDFQNVQKKLEQMGIDTERAELQRIPNDTKTRSVDQSLQILRIVEAFEDDDDVQNVFHNLEVSEEVEAAMDA